MSTGTIDVKDSISNRTYAKDSEEEEKDKVVLENDFLCDANLPPRPFFLTGEWLIQPPDMDTWIRTFHSYIGDRSEEREEIINDMENESGEIISKSITENQIHKLFEGCDEDTRRGVEKNLNKINKWQTYLRIDSSKCEFERIGAIIKEDAKQYVRKVANRFAECHPDSRNIKTEVRTWEEFPPETHRALKAYDGWLDDVEKEEILTRSVSSIQKPSVWIIVGDLWSEDDFRRTDSPDKLTVEYTFKPGYDAAIVPSIHQDKNNQAEQNMKGFINSLSESAQRRLRKSHEPITFRFDESELTWDSIGEYESQRKEIAISGFEKMRDGEDKLVSTMKDIIHWNNFSTHLKDTFGYVSSNKLAPYNKAKELEHSEMVRQNQEYASQKLDYIGRWWAQVDPRRKPISVDEHSPEDD
ncbi:hypothetical protein L486_03826 [Kwoniella mangroviensis CBS 10435]|uniref:Uncharacterized protein n=1 Tax=Kwoniella mangroviensis CBS 10435 TaxID=1331196 RepID=A0A1B9IUZ0_9TREE|nr:hypothetical protein L486_03826 [Kwoniella mangroviensis CBS 10435]